MAKKRNKIKKKASRAQPQSYRSLFYGFLTVLILFVGALFILNVFPQRGKGELTPQAANTEVVLTPTPVVLAAADQSVSEQKITRSTYEVVEGDNLWQIAVRAYGDGYKWVEIAEANNLSNPDLIYPGDKFTLPR
jgi:LysM repeat protein